MPVCEQCDTLHDLGTRCPQCFPFKLWLVVIFALFLFLPSCKTEEKQTQSEHRRLLDSLKYEDYKLNKAIFTPELIYLIKANQTLYHRREAQYMLSYIGVFATNDALADCDPALWKNKLPSFDREELFNRLLAHNSKETVNNLKKYCR